MILFWLICALLVAIALAFVLPPMIENGAKADDNEEGNDNDANLAVYRDQLAELERDAANGLIDQDQLAQDREELERRLLEDVSASKSISPEQSTPAVANRNYVYAIALGIPLLAVVIYLQIGNLKAMTSSPVPTGRGSAPAPPEEIPQGEGQRSQADIEANVAGLAKRLQENPNDLQGWIMLGRSYMSFEKYTEASNAYAKASELKPDDASLLADYAFALALANGRSLKGKPTELINKALKLDPENAKALELAGSAAFEEKDYKRALEVWQKLLAKLPPGSEVAQALSERIEETKALSANK